MRLTFWNERKAHYDWHCENNEIADKLAAYEDTELSPEEFKEKSESVLELYGKLKPYADAEEQGRLVILPCKAGDTVYYLTGNPILASGYHFNRVESTKCIGFYWDREGLQICLYMPHGNHGTYGRYGKSIFLTREEAEAALKGGRGDANN